MTDVQQLIERSFFEAIRLKLVAEAYTPDITTFDQTATGFTAYQAALSAIATGAKGFAVEVFGSANPNSRGLKNVPRITLDTDTFLPGSIGIGSDPVMVKDPETNKFEIFNYDRLSYDLYLNCVVSAETQAQLRVLMNIVHHAIPLLGFLPFYSDADQQFMVELDSFQPLGRPADGVLEHNYRYEIPDIQWRDPVKAVEVVSPISEITLNLKIAEHLGISHIIS